MSLGSYAFEKHVNAAKNANRMKGEHNYTLSAKPMTTKGINTPPILPTPLAIPIPVPLILVGYVSTVY